MHVKAYRHTPLPLPMLIARLLQRARACGAAAPPCEIQTGIVRAHSSGERKGTSMVASGGAPSRQLPTSRQHLQQKVWCEGQSLEPPNATDTSTECSRSEKREDPSSTSPSLVSHGEQPELVPSESLVPFPPCSSIPRWWTLQPISQCAIGSLSKHPRTRSSTRSREDGSELGANADSSKKPRSQQ